MTLKITPAWLVLVVLLYMLALVGTLALVLVLTRESQPSEGRPLRTRPPVRLEPRT